MGVLSIANKCLVGGRPGKQGDGWNENGIENPGGGRSLGREEYHPYVHSLKHSPSVSQDHLVQEKILVFMLSVVHGASFSYLSVNA